ncbi:tRNA glutamyl-Q(34) synthetase GluQRS [Alteromonas oceanisediminis]|uniref:tRNA glutamyl-Q(34) synthetase GluQRS n=1 Tax=Alteromonas oceanisediminis TaxID=2836180 RepID=UPI001BD9C557|nr:tRNA glutamyl-Q(34) synthetase GluQRS [Alteromonas oceanisediminis]MBT0587684.1 tRNA glutamyl-Q(34) synthetase GluQRS [Alteromonas oceanisediminis]
MSRADAGINTGSNYVGRFAPSPSGPLHFGSLTTALGSYLHAKQRRGKWLLRIEDIDHPRSVPGADEQIKTCLLAHGLEWDGEVRYQSHHHDDYAAALTKLDAHLYECDCTRASIRQNQGIHDPACRNRAPQNMPFALRFLNQSPRSTFTDELQGSVDVAHSLASEDFVLKRRDGLYAYHLAVVCDDILQGVTHIVRGADLIDTTFCHLALYEALNHTPPSYLHLPVMSTSAQQKLSKQNHAPAVDHRHAKQNLIHALLQLGITCPKTLCNDSVQAILQWALEHVDFAKIPRVREVIVPKG